MAAVKWQIFQPARPRAFNLRRSRSNAKRDANLCDRPTISACRSHDRLPFGGWHTGGGVKAPAHPSQLSAASARINGALLAPICRACVTENNPN